MPGQDMMQLGIQVAPGGGLDAFGVLYSPSWTRISTTINAGDVRIQLKVCYRCCGGTQRQAAFLGGASL